MLRRVFDERVPLEPSYPSTLPSIGDSPEFDKELTYEREMREDSPMAVEKGDADLAVRHAPPGSVTTVLWGIF